MIIVGPVELGLGPVVVVVVVVVVVELLLTAHSFDVWNRPVTYTYILYRATASTRAAQATNHRWQRARSFDGRRRWREEANGLWRRRSPLEKLAPIDRRPVGRSLVSQQISVRCCFVRASGLCCKSSTGGSVHFTKAGKKCFCVCVRYGNTRKERVTVPQEKWISLSPDFLSRVKPAETLSTNFLFFFSFLRRWCWSWHFARFYQVSENDGPLYFLPLHVWKCAFTRSYLLSMLSAFRKPSFLLDHHQSSSS